MFNFRNLSFDDIFFGVVCIVTFLGVAMFLTVAFFPPTAEANNKAPLKYTEVCIDEVTYLEYNPKSGSVAALSPKYKTNGEIETCSN